MRTTAIGRRTTRLAWMLALLTTTALAGNGCEALKSLTDPDSPTDRAISVKSTPETLPEGGGEVTIEATVTSGGAPELGVEVTFRTTAGTFVPSDRATTDAAGVARVRLNTTTTADVTASVEAGGVQVASSTAHKVAVGDDVVASGAIQLAFEFSSKPAPLNEPVTITVTGTNPEGAGARGRLTVEFGDGRQRSENDFRKKATFEHTYREESIFNVVASLTEEDGTVSRATGQIKVADKSVTTIALSHNANTITARDPVTFTVTLSRAQGRAATGDVDFEWGDGRTSRLRDVRNRATIDHTFRDPGGYRVRATVTAPNGKTDRADLRIVAVDRVTIQVRVETSAGQTGEETPIEIVVTRSDGKKSNGVAIVNFGDGTSQNVSVSGGSATVEHTYASEGTYTVSVDYADSEGRSASVDHDVEISDQVVVPGVAVDEIDPDSIVWHRLDISGWTIASNLLNASATSGRQVLDHTKKGQWPAADLFDGDHAGPDQPLEGNAWVVVNFGGTWHAAPFEWLISGETVKTVPADQFPDHIKTGPFLSWIPQPGETIGMLASARAWAGVTDVHERTQIRIVTWQ